MRFFKKKGNRTFSIVCVSIAIIFIVITIVANVLTFGTYRNALISYFGVEGATVESYDSNQYFDRHAPNAESASDAAASLSRQIIAEGSVLLKNENNALPLSSGSKISFFSQASVDFIYGQTGGSGAIGSSAKSTLKKAFEAENIQVNPILWNFYVSKNYHRLVGGLAQSVQYYEANPFQINEIPYREYTNEVINSYSSYHDAAIIVISRTGCENGDLPRSMFQATNGANTGSILELDSNERDLISNVTQKFDKVIVLLNTSNPMECGFLNEYGIDACLWVGGVGEFGINSVAQIISGKRNPSGRLVDTYAYDVFSSPAMQNMGNFEYWEGGTETEHHYLTYDEGIYVGYKYYETRYEDKMLNQGNAGNYNYNQVVQFPFGYGLSYTTFAWSNFRAEIKGDQVEVKVKVTNTGKKVGKDVVEIYYQSPYTQYDKTNNIEKASVNLIAFEKTQNIAPGRSEIIVVTFNIEDMKSYDAHNKKTYYLEGSTKNDKYYVTAAHDAHNAINNILKAKNIDTDGSSEFVENNLAIKERVYNIDTYTNHEVTNRFDGTDGKQYHRDIKYLSRKDWSQMDNNGIRYGALTGKNGSIDMEGEEYKTNLSSNLKKVLETIGYEASGAPNENFKKPKTGQVGDLKLINLKGRDFNDPNWELLLNQVTIDEMVNLARFSGYKTDAIESASKPYTTDLDGPQAWTSFIGNGLSSGGLPYAIVIASTWDKIVAEKVGYIMGEICLWQKISENSSNAPNLTGWYAPAMNIHRTPFGGRNFEYYSECGVLSGEIGAKITKGATERGVVTYIKHFALNEQDRNRMTDNATWVEEQAIREVYLKPFEKSIKEGKSLAVMTSYNRIGTTWAGGNYHLITEILRNEWGFNGFVLSDYMDGVWENVDQMLAAGGDAALNSVDNNLTKCTSNSAQAVTYLRRATHHCLYAFGNSNAMNGYDGATKVTGGTPVFHKIMFGINLCLSAIIIVSIGLIPLRLFVFDKRKNNDELENN